MRRTLIAAFASSLVALPAMFTSVAADDARYSIVETENGMVRVDRQNGAVSYCRTVGSGMTCSIAADERQAWQAELEAMAERIDTLNDRIAALEATGDAPATAPPSAVKPETEDSTELSGNEERQVDKAMRVAERLLRGMIGIAKDVKQDWETR